MKEIWKNVVGYEDRYMVSNLGNIKSIFVYAQNKENKRLNIHGVRQKNIYIGIDNNGYSFVILRQEGKKIKKSVHRLVAKSFLPKKENNDIVNHKNGNKLDNELSNLEWCDKRYNMIHAIEKLGIKRDGEFNPNSKYTNKQIQELIDLHNQGKSVYYCYKKLNINRTSAYRIINKTK
tara:strand:+ start:6963 stop:7493 length:531 start_codon:yes stop_codon:yes gene_type:complete